MSAKQYMIDNLKALRFEQKVLLLDNICRFNGSSVEIKQTEPEVFELNGLDFLDDNKLSADTVDDVMARVINQFAKGKNCADTATMVIMSACINYEF